MRRNRGFRVQWFFKKPLRDSLDVAKTLLTLICDKVLKQLEDQEIEDEIEIHCPSKPLIRSIVIAS